MGSLANISNNELAIMACFVFPTVIGSLLINKQLDAILLGENYAFSLGGVVQSRSLDGGGAYWGVLGDRRIEISVSQKDIEIVLIQDRPFAVYGRAFQSVRDKGIAVNRKTDVVKVKPREAGLGKNVQVFRLVAPVIYAAPYVGVVISRSDYNGKSRFFDGVKALAHSRGGHEATVEKVARNDHGITALVLGLFQGLGEAQSVLLYQPVALAQAEAREGAVQVEITRMEEFYCFLYHYRVTSVLVLIVFFLLYHFVLRASIAAGHVGGKLIFTRRIYPS